MQTSRTQPAVSYLGTTIQAEFPLLLIFGREYNNDPRNAVDGLGPYCFLCSPRSAFWNRSYGFLSRVSNRPLKEMCTKRGQSPILFSNVLPRPLPAKLSGADKRAQRQPISDGEIDEYVRGIFRLPILDRLKLVIFSGVSDQLYGPSVKRIRDHCTSLKVQVLGMDYLGSRESYESIEASVPSSGPGLMRDLVDRFCRTQSDKCSQRQSEYGPCDKHQADQ